MSYNEKLARVLRAAVMATPEDLDKLHDMASVMVPDGTVEKIRSDRADLCTYIPFMDENDTELLATSARTMQRR